MAQYILFDLDGTLTDSGPGIIQAVLYALERMGRPEPDVEKVRRTFIGPPLTVSFQQPVRLYPSAVSAGHRLFSGGLQPQGHLQQPPLRWHPRAAP